ncbi:MAG: hypothetical protein H6742_14680 [Alphaproteobacteria bacterium]|nr:hypothetical protein [Alphaproteobacteria bacterium]
MRLRTLTAAPVLLLLGSTGLLACTTDEPPDTLPDWSAGYEADAGDETGGDGGTFVVPDTQTTIELAVPDEDDIGYFTWIHEAGTQADCAFEPGEDYTDYQSIDCVLETEELDLFFNGLTFDFLVPEGACDYVAWHHFQYEAWEVGTGPTDVSYTVQVDGTITDEVNSFNGVPYCEYDYSTLANDYPNCCLGTYNVTVTYEQAGGGEPITEVSPAFGWDGEPSSCYAGAAFDDPEVQLTADGWPISRQVFTDKDSYGKRFDWDELSDEFGTNVTLANYYDPADHDGTMPAGHAGAWAYPTYDFYCYDNAEEVIASLHLQVQEWNQHSLFYDGGDPDVTGEENNGSGSPIDDRKDWAVATPGSTTWIMDAQ